MSEAKAEILKQIRLATGGSSNNPKAEWSQLPRRYNQRGLLAAPERLELFIDRLHDYDAATHCCNSGAVADTIAQCLAAHGKSRIAVAAGFPAELLPANFSFQTDTGLSYFEIDATEGVITTCAIAIALTGTIVLQEGAAGQGTRPLSLIPDYHLCVVREDQIVETVPEGFRALEPTSTLPITTISGPSATSDIEMIRIRGVHGPRTLEVIVVGA